MQIEMIASGINMRHAFDTLGVDQGEMNRLGFRHHAEVLKRMRGHDPGRGADARSIKGLFRMSKQGQERFQEFLFPTKRRSRVSKAGWKALVAAAETSDRWLKTRAPAS